MFPVGFGILGVVLFFTTLALPVLRDEGRPTTALVVSALAWLATIPLNAAAFVAVVQVA